MITLRRWLCRFGLLLVVLALAAERVDAAPRWRVLETPRFTVVSQISEKETRAWAEEFNQFIESFGGSIKTSERFLPKLTVVVFAGENAFRPYLPKRPNGEQREVAGYFSHRETWGVIGMADCRDDERTRRVIFHEGVHWLLSDYRRNLPRCLSEGLAEVFSTFKLEKGRAQWGAVCEGHVRFLQHQKQSIMPIETLLQTSSNDSLFNENERTGIFYAESWIFVHFLMFGQHSGSRSALGDFLEAYGKGAPMTEAFRAAFGMDFVSMDENLATYLTSGEYSIRSSQVGGEKKLSGEFVAASAERVEVALAKLALSVGLNELARKHVEAAVKIAPQNPLCYDTLAFVQDNENPGIGGYEAARRAVALGSKDAATFMIEVTGRIREGQKLGGLSPAEARKIANQIEKAINLQPNLKAAYRQLGDLLEDVEDLTGEDMRFLRQALEIFPDEAGFFIKLARLVHKSGNYPQAIKLLGRVYDIRERLTSGAVEQARDLEQRWTYDDYVERVKVCADAERYDEAIAALDETLKNDRLSSSSKAEFAQKKNTFVILLRWQEVHRAMQENRRDEARTLLRELVAEPLLPGYLKRQAEEYLKRLGG